MKKIKKLFKNHSPYLVGLTLFEIILSIIATLSFVYSDTLTYSDSLVIEQLGIEKLLESLYTSTWWALILFLLAFIAILSLTSIVYKKLEYFFISICCWVEMIILALNLNSTLKDNIFVLLLGLPILIINIIAYKSEKNILNKKKKKDEDKITKSDIICYSLLGTLIVVLVVVLIFLISNIK